MSKLLSRLTSSRHPGFFQLPCLPGKLYSLLACVPDSKVATWSEQKREQRKEVLPDLHGSLLMGELWSSRYGHSRKECTAKNTSQKLRQRCQSSQPHHYKKFQISVLVMQSIKGGYKHPQLRGSKRSSCYSVWACPDKPRLHTYISKEHFQ